MPTRRKPTALKVVEGRAGARKALAAEPQPDPITDAEPTSPLTARERELFDGAMALLQPMGHVGTIDLYLVTMWAVTVAQWERASDDVRKRGAIVAGARGKESVKNPSAGMVRDFAALANRLAADLGMSPAARVGMKVSQRRVGSLEDLLAGRQE
jgi:P27 family predicted phage terminase small subunit